MGTRTFELRGPLAHSEEVLGGSPASQATNAVHARVLVVEDDVNVRKSTIALLTALGYEPDAVSSGEQAIAAYTQANEAQHPYDIVLLDQMLSGHIGGTETMRLLRNLDPDVKAILLSGQAYEADDARIQRIGFQTCLQKPVSMAALKAAIEGVLQ